MAGQILFDRRASLVIKPVTFSGAGRKVATIGDAYPAFNPVTNLRIVFSCSKTIENEPNRGRISVYNLAPSKREIAKKKDKIYLSVGYATQADPLPLLCVGDISGIVNRAEGPDWVTEFEFGDGEVAHRLASINDLLPAGGQLTDLFKKLKDRMRDLGVEIMSIFDQSVASLLADVATRATNDAESGGTSIGGAPITDTAQNVIGRVSDLLTGECDRMGLSWSIQNNVLIIRRKGTRASEEIVNLSPSTGLLDTPQKTEKGVNGRALIIPQAMPGGLVQLESIRQPSVNGQYVFTKLDFTGDTHGPNWEMSFETMVEGTRLQLSGS